MKIQQLVRRTMSLLALALFLVTALRVSPAAAARPSRVLLSQGPITISRVCAFDVQSTPTASKEYLTTFTDKNGAVTMQIVTGAFKVKLTNLSTGYSQDLNISGPGKIRYNPDGSGEFMSTGAGLVWGISGLTNLPALAFFHGRLTIQFDSQGNIIATSFNGQVTDECAALNH